jgi:DNA-binding NtrC family response regulator
METRIKLLFVDDEEDFLKTTAERLETRDFDVIAVNSGEKALEAARDNEIDIALVDLNMPGFNGEETLKALKRQHQWTEIVILTGYGDIKSAIDCTKHGAYAYLQKPCDLEQLLVVLKEAFKKRVANKHKIEKARMEKMLEIVQSSSTKDIFTRLKEIDAGRF